MKLTTYIHTMLKATPAGDVIDICRGLSFKIDVEAIEAAVKTHSPKLLFLTSPNNPDGSLIEEDDLLRLLRLPILVVLDEAYIEFASAKSYITQVPSRKNLIVLRTFSKRAALAGGLLRCVSNFY